MQDIQLLLFIIRHILCTKEHPSPPPPPPSLYLLWCDTLPCMMMMMSMMMIVVVWLLLFRASRQYQTWLLLPPVETDIIIVSVFVSPWVVETSVLLSGLTGPAMRHAGWGGPSSSSEMAGSASCVPSIACICELCQHRQGKHSHQPINVLYT